MMIEYVQALHDEVRHAIEERFEGAWRVTRIKLISHAFYTSVPGITASAGTRVSTMAEFCIEATGNVAAFVDPLPKMRCRAYLSENGLHIDMESVGVTLGEKKQPSSSRVVF
jgi:hypothetical protein